jgi:hypothetical protein
MATTTQASVSFVARATATGERIEATAANEVVAFYRRQTGLVATDVEWVSCDHPAVTAAPDSGGVEHVLDALAEAFEGGVPLGIVTAAMSKQGWTVGETLDALYDRRMAGALWEPRDDHLRPV